MFSKPAIWIICDMQLSLHDFSPIFEVFQLVPWILRLCACWRLNSRLDTSWIRIKERNNFIVAIMFFDEFFDFGLNGILATAKMVGLLSLSLLSNAFTTSWISEFVPSGRISIGVFMIW
jgi:hypothetical protein